MNPDTRIVVCCYAGEAHQFGLDIYLHHECPVLILSPEDSPVTVNLPNVYYRFGGKRAYIGQDSLDRQRRHLEILLEYPQNHFLIHDADSVCLDPVIPQYLYDEPDIVWSNQVDDAMPEHQATFLEGWPHVAFQPPYFLSRKTIEAMLAVANDPRCAASPMMPFIDYYMVQLTMVAGLPWRRFMNCLSCRITYPIRGKDAAAALRGDAVMVHSVKDPRTVRGLLEARKNFLTRHPVVVPSFIGPPRITGGRS
jgi:hypothetical protein